MAGDKADPKKRSLRAWAEAVVLPIFRQLVENARFAGGNLAFDLAVLAACFLLFEANNLLVKPHLVAVGATGVGAAILQFHANDFLGGIAFLAYANLLLDLVQPRVRFHRATACLAFILLCGLFWELAAPLFVPGSVGDPWDMLAYALGGACYCLLNWLQQGKRMPTHS